jgi:hypothetical protein
MMYASSSCSATASAERPSVEIDPGQRGDHAGERPCVRGHHDEQPPPVAALQPHDRGELLVDGRVRKPGRAPGELLALIAPCSAPALSSSVVNACATVDLPAPGAPVMTMAAVKR